MQPAIRFGIDLGGTKTEIVALAPDGRELLRRRVVTPREDYRATLDALTRLVTDAERELGDSGSVGLGTPGSISRATGLLRGSNSVCLNGQPIKRDLERRLGREIRITNDANCFALSEASDGAAQGAAVVHGVIVGTGVGSGIVVHGRVLAGANGIELCIGSMIFERDILPPTINQENPDPQCDLDYVPNVMRRKKINCMLKTSSGFSGIHSAMVLKRFVG